MSKFIAIRLVARLDTDTLEEREALERRIMQVLGCNETESDCPMVLYASTVVHDAGIAINWLQ